MNREQSKIQEKRFGHTKIIGAPPPLDPLVKLTMQLFVKTLIKDLLNCNYSINSCIN